LINKNKNSNNRSPNKANLWRYPPPPNFQPFFAPPFRRPKRPSPQKPQFHRNLTLTSPTPITKVNAYNLTLLNSPSPIVKAALAKKAQSNQSPYYLGHFKLIRKGIDARFLVCVG
jgi:hypothetical protein